MSAPVAEGDLILEKYRVERVLGQGGMGVVVAATHVDLDQKVALKFLLPEALAHADIVERFAREAKAAAKIQSQHVVRVIDTGRMPSGAPFMVMEYLEGEDLGALLERDHRLSTNVAADYLLQACEAIGEAHAAGIVHRDLKPSNLFLARQRDRRQMIKVLDFGISKLDDPKAAPITQTATMLGSPHYMSPEQLVSSKSVDARSDLWALGVILYELVSGHRPFEGDTMPEVVGKILQNAPAPLSSLVPGLSPEVERIVARCLTNTPDKRFASVAELAAALRPLATDAATASASVARISRVLGGASLPPSAAASSVSAAESVAPTMRPPTKVDAETLPEGAAPTARSPGANPPITAVSASMSAERPRPESSRRGVVIGGVVALAVAGALVLRQPRTSTSEASPEATRDKPVVTTTVTASAAPPATPSAEPAASASTVSPAVSATIAPSASASAPVPTATSRRTKPTTPQAATTTTASPTPSKSPLQMGIK
ncbi:MAG: protein kinase [Polyangiaceae bacterium]